MQITYDVNVTCPNEDPQTARITRDDLPITSTVETLTLKILAQIETTLEKIETGKRGTFRLGTRIFIIIDERIPVIDVKIVSVIYNQSEQEQLKTTLETSTA